MSIKLILGTIFDNLGLKNKPELKFFITVFELIFSIQGRINFENLSRYSNYNELTFRRRFDKFFDWLKFNHAIINQAGVGLEGKVIAAVDCSFISKSGKSTFGLDNFWSGCANRAKKGLEISVLAMIDVASGRAWTVDVTQTGCDLENSTEQITKKKTSDAKSAEENKASQGAKLANQSAKAALKTAQLASKGARIAYKTAQASKQTTKQALKQAKELARAAAAVTKQANQAVKITTLAAKQAKIIAKQTPDTYSRIDTYIEQIADCLPYLVTVNYFVADGYYAKTKFIQAILGFDKHLITKLRPDANLKFRFEGEQAHKKGPKSKFGGKVTYKDLSKWTFVGKDTKYDYLNVYHQVCFSVQFQCWLGVALVINTKNNKYILLASTDIQQEATEILTFYQLRFKIEFLFRDAKQFAGLTHCQARSETKLDFHFNLSLAAINILQLLKIQDPTCTSTNTFVRTAYNTRIVELLLMELGLNAEFDLLNPKIQKIINLGADF